MGISKKFYPTDRKNLHKKMQVYQSIKLGSSYFFLKDYTRCLRRITQQTRSSLEAGGNNSQKEGIVAQEDTSKMSNNIHNVE